MKSLERLPVPLREDALAIWQAGVRAVASEELVSRQIHPWQGGLSIAGVFWRARPGSRICVVGAGKAGAGMAAGVERALGPAWIERTTGWVNVPDNCVRPLHRIHLHGARPQGVNEPTPAGVVGTCEILRSVEKLHEQDLCIVLISGGGSALLPAPISGLSLEDKQQLTRALMRSGATIQELNAVRRSLSEVKGGGLLRACRAGLLVALILSDVIGDPLETIASGPTVDIPPDPEEALRILQRLPVESEAPFSAAAVRILQAQANAGRTMAGCPPCRFANRVIGNNQTAVVAAAREASRLGYRVAVQEFDQPGVAREFGADLAERLLQLRNHDGDRPIALISGGETTVQLTPTSGPQRGGRNQELVLAATQVLLHKDTRGLVLLSGGTDGEDGPTDAAGAVVDSMLLEQVRQSGIDPEEFLRVNNSYPFFDRFGGLIRTGPTDTNVMDLRIGLVRPAEADGSLL
jgi:hydroxypyruvate reductase